MKKNKTVSSEKPFEARIQAYAKLSRAVLLRPIKNPKCLLPLGAAFLAGVPAGDAAIIYSGVQNTGCALGGNSNKCFADLDNAGGNDLEIHRHHNTSNQVIRINKVAGGGFAVNGFYADVSGGVVYPLANASNVPIGGGGPFGLHNFKNILSQTYPVYVYEKWTPLPNGTTRFVGFRGVKNSTFFDK